ncbi:hypothetical protein GHT06_021763 [Daphnia sinensis]|uniref:Zinc carboxypeptidase A 1 n=1 Tax=Daphnia sinensis TaxID=1820382 RepID=A0AAD5PQC6_9CRUS|nr:hypothetical protein GHT06_021763 [Daphnia sinensis]
MRFLLLLALLAASALAAQKRYDGYKVFQVKAKDLPSFHAIAKLHTEQSSIYDFWTEPRSLDDPIDIMVPPTYMEAFDQLLQTHNLHHRVKIADVQSAIENNLKGQAAPSVVQEPRSRSGSLRYKLNWTEYHDYTTIVLFLAELAQNYPNIVTLITIGKTHENREMYMVKISNNQTASATKNAIIVDGGIHAREWISPAWNTWLIHELVENYAAHPQYVDNLDWFILPVMNPDGYVYSFADDRLWRKNRNPVNGPCVGIDLNLEPLIFFYFTFVIFLFALTEGGAAGNGCDQTYHGPSAFSEDESANVRDAILSVANGRTKAYLTYHSYGQYWLTPWGYTADLPEDYPQLFDLAQNAVNSLTAVYGTQYTIGSSTNVLYVASGGSDDWAKGGAGIPYSYTVELRDTGDFGFLLPADQIIPNNLEMWEAMKVVAEYITGLV